MAKRQRVSCDQCEMLSINGLACHEISCPNMGGRWDDGEGWVKQRKCFDCGCTVDADDPCCSAEELFEAEDADDDTPEVCDCGGARFLICTRSDGFDAVEVCDLCNPDPSEPGWMDDADAAIIAEGYGIAAMHSYPCYVVGRFIAWPSATF
jgi:hypothetical protein